jgi:uncharacterized protein YciI
LFIIHLTYTAPLEEIDRQLAPHQAWVNAGLAEGVFVAAGPLVPRTGGVILAHGLTRAALEARLAEDPFVKAGLVRVEVLDHAIRAADPRLAFLKSG